MVGTVNASEESKFLDEVKRVLKLIGKMKNGPRTEDQLKKLLFEEDLDGYVLSEKEHIFYNWVVADYNTQIEVCMDWFSGNKKLCDSQCFKITKEFRERAQRF